MNRIPHLIGTQSKAWDYELKKSLTCVVAKWSKPMEINYEHL